MAGGVGVSSGLRLRLSARRLVPFPDAGTTVNNWRDFSGEGNDVSVTSSSTNPTFQPKIQANQSCLRFDGTDNFLTIADDSTLDWSGDFEVMWVGAFDALNAIEDVLAHKDNQKFALGKTNTSNGDVQLAGVNRTSVIGGTAVTAGAWQIHGLKRESDDCQLFLDGSADGAVVTKAGDLSVAELFYIGCSNSTLGGSNQSFFNGDIAEVVAFDRALTTAERLIYTQWFNHIYKLGISGVSPYPLKSLNTYRSQKNRRKKVRARR